MFTVTSKLNYDKLRQEQNAAQYEQMLIQSSLNNTQKAMEGFLTLANGDTKYEKELKQDEYYIKLVADETLYETQLDNLDTQLEMLEEEIDTYQEGIKQGIEQSTNLWCFGGG